VFTKLTNRKITQQSKIEITSTTYDPQSSEHGNERAQSGRQHEN